MALSAIVLEEAYGRGNASSDDGMLTPLELQNIDLRGTEMLVLSQCQMANGLASVGEGVYGMRRAAAIAGAENVCRTALERRGRRPAHADGAVLHGSGRGADIGPTRCGHAKLQLRRSPATSSFLYWAPVILSGSASALPASLFSPGRAAARELGSIHNLQFTDLQLTEEIT